MAAPAFAQDMEPKVQARLVAEHTAVAPGGSTTIALEEQIAPKWHTYWKNPGDAGAPTVIEMDLAVRMESRRHPMAASQAPAGRAADGLWL